MKTKDIVFLCQFFYPEYITSALLPYQTAEYLTKKGHSVSAICGYPKEYLKDGNGVPKRETVNNIDIKRIKYLQLDRSNMLYRMINYLSFVVMMFLQLREIGKHKVVIVYSNPPILPLIALIAKKIYNTKIVFVSYDIYPEIALETKVLSENSISVKFMNWLNHKLFSQSDRVIALSNEMKEKLVETRPIKSEKIVVIENWATEDIGQAVNNTRNQAKILTIGYFGNMGIPQDFDTILGMLKDSRIKNNPNVNFVFAGHGNQRDRISNELKKNNINNVTMYGYLTGNEYTAAIEETDVFLLSLKKELTGLAVPSKFYTYLLMNKYILSVISEETDIAKHTKEHKIGNTVSNGDVEGLINVIIDLIKYPTKREPTKDIYLKHFNKNIQLKKYNSVLTKLVN